MTQEARTHFKRKHAFCALICREEVVNNSPTTNPTGRLSLSRKRPNLDESCLELILWSVWALKSLTVKGILPPCSGLHMWAPGSLSGGWKESALLLAVDPSWVWPQTMQTDLRNWWQHVSNENEPPKRKATHPAAQAGTESNRQYLLSREEGFSILMSPSMHQNFLNKARLKVGKGGRETLAKCGDCSQATTVSKAWSPNLRSKGGKSISLVVVWIRWDEIQSRSLVPGVQAELCQRCL